MGRIRSVSHLVKSILLLQIHSIVTIADDTTSVAFYSDSSCQDLLDNGSTDETAVNGSCKEKPDGDDSTANSVNALQVMPDCAGIPDFPNLGHTVQEH